MLDCKVSGHAIVIPGITGNLFQEKLDLAAQLLVDRLPVDHTSNGKFRIIGAGRKPLSNVCMDNRRQSFGSIAAYVRAVSDRRPRQILSGEAWHRYLNAFSFVQTGEHGENVGQLFAEIDAFKAQNPKGLVSFYLSVPYQANRCWMEVLATHLPQRSWADDVRVYFEKPAEISVSGVRDLLRLCDEAKINRSCAFQIDHFLGKQGLVRLIPWLLSELPHSLRPTAQNVRKLVIKIYEKIGVNGREYGGIDADSIRNHNTLVWALAVWVIFFSNGNPISPAEAAMIAIRWMASKTAHISETNEVFDNVAGLQELAPRGRLALCHEEQGEPGSKFATAIHLRYNMDPVAVHVYHAKNTGEKCTGCAFGLEDGYTVKAVIEEVIDGRRRCGWQIFKDGVVVNEHFEDVPDYMGDGYPMLFENLYCDRRDLFLPLEFTLESNRFHTPTMRRMHEDIETYPGYSRSSDPFATEIDENSEAFLRPLFEAPAA